MIIIGERINAIASGVKEAIEKRDAPYIEDLAQRQTQCGADYLDCMAGRTKDPYQVMKWLIKVVQDRVDTPLCIDSGDPRLLKRLIESVDFHRPGIINSVSGAGKKGEILFPMIAGTPWKAIVLTCDDRGVPKTTADKVEIVKRLLEQADYYGVAMGQLIFDPCIMALVAVPGVMKTYMADVAAIRSCAPEAMVLGAISNISYNMPERSVINAACMTMAIQAGAEAMLVDPCDQDITNARFAAAVLMDVDHRGLDYNRAWRDGRILGCSGNQDKGEG